MDLPGKRRLQRTHVVSDQHKLIDGNPPTSPDQIDSPTDPTNLTWMGQLLWDLAHKDAA